MERKLLKLIILNNCKPNDDIEIVISKMKEVIPEMPKGYVIELFNELLNERKKD